ncbi:hypothetical protein EV421DRAFT_304407 [Armillaria borealis]|uniref:HAM1-like N-terminal domain-containing protein n=1 Tax=Armillaria borealis TaxID=47425 RepID=A0AA39JQ80_9AGAR|nr:hypothetical protein EV421DRAFT_304407 [Armillaria borealis]
MEVDIDMGRVWRSFKALKRRIDTDAATYHVLTLVNLVLTDSELPKLIKDFSAVNRDLAVKVVAPSADQLKDVDKGHFVPDEEKLKTRVPGVNDQPDAIDPKVERLLNAEITARAMRKGKRSQAEVSWQKSRSLLSVKT